MRRRQVRRAGEWIPRFERTCWNGSLMPVNEMNFPALMLAVDMPRCADEWN